MALMPTTAFVTGGSGFLGRNLIAALRARGDTVRALARSDSAVETVRAAGAEPVRGDLDAGDALSAAMRGCSVVFHSAATVKVWGDPREFHHVNVEGTEHMLAAARAAAVSKLVHVSTEAVLVGGPRMVRADETWPRPTHPIGLYPRTKGMAEERVLAANSPSLATVIVRPRFIWGAGDSSVMSELVRAVHEGRFRWIGGGHHLTSTCHVANVCEGMIAAAERGRGGEIYFLTDGPPVELRAFLTELLAAVGVDAGSGELPLWAARAIAWTGEAVWRALRLGGEPPATRSAVRLIGEEVTVDDAKARRELGYVGAMTREAGLAAVRASAKAG
jgi:nucleoside-diphosphate-sugar epimerase